MTSDANATELGSSESFRDVPHSMVRRTIASRLTEAKQTVPHFYMVVRCEVDALYALRRHLNSQASEVKVSVNDFVVRAVALALRRTPEANATYSDTAMRFFHDVDVAAAVATARGLITPILRQADRKQPRDIAREMHELVERARAGRLKPHEYMGGTATVSNLGMFGVEEFSAIINPPQSCIFAVGTGVQSPVVRNGKIEVVTVMTTTVSFDHRVIDGDVAARLTASYKEFLEHPEQLL